MKRIELYEYVELLSGFSLVYFMLDRMERDIDMECPMGYPDDKLPELEDYLEEILDWLEQQPSVSSELATILHYAKNYTDEDLTITRTHQKKR